MRGSSVFCCSNCISFNPTSHLNLILILFFSGILLSYHNQIDDNLLMIKSYIRSVTYLLITWNLFEYIWHGSRIIILSGDKDTIDGTKRSFCVSVHKFDVICLSEIWCYLSHDEKLEIPSYNIITGNHPCNNNCRGAAFIIETHYLLN